jgi:hypothetical protein
MTINLERFTKDQEFVIPIVSGWGQHASRKVWKRTEDGWYVVSLGNTIKVIRKATAMEIVKTLQPLKKLSFYALGNEGIPVNFDNLERMGFSGAVTINFLNSPVFEVARVVRWEDGRFYFCDNDPRFQRDLLNILRARFDASQSITSLPTVTPELFYYFMLISLEHQAFREVTAITTMKLSEEEKAKRVEQFKNTFDERLKKTIQDAGGTMIRFSKANANSYLVTWRIGNQTVKSTITDNFSILNAGFCLSGDDRSHSMASLIQLAKMFRRDQPLYITRE